MFKNQKLQAYLHHQKIYQNSISTIKSEIKTSQRQKRSLRFVKNGSPIKFGLPPRKTMNSNYFLYGKCLIHQINEEIQIEVISNESFKEKIKELTLTIKKISGPERGQLSLKMMGLYLKMNIPFEENCKQIYKDGWKYFQNLLKSKEKSKVIDLISLQRVDQMLVKYLNQYLYDKLYWETQFPQIIRQFSRFNTKAMQCLTKKQIEEYKKNIEIFLNFSTFHSLKSYSKTFIKRRSSRKFSKNSLASDSSSQTDEYQERIVKFNERNKRQSYVKNLYSITQKVRRKVSGTTSKGKISESLNKRVSSRWGKNIALPIQKDNAQIQNKGSVFCYEQKNVNSKQEQEQVKKKKLMRTIHNRIATFFEKIDQKEEYKSFYFFVKVKDIFQCLEAKKINILSSKTSSQLLVSMKGFIQQTIKLRINEALNEKFISENQLRVYLLDNLSLRKKNFSFQFYPQRKKKESQNPQKNILNETKLTDYEILYSFIRKFNVYFFEKLTYESSKGKIQIYDKFFDELLETKQVEVRKPEKMFFLNELEFQQEYQQKYRPIFEGFVEVFDNHLKLNKQREQMKIYKKYSKKITKKSEKNRQFQTIKMRNGNFQVIEKKMNKTENNIIFSNTKFQNNKNIEVEKIQNCLNYGKVISPHKIKTIKEKYIEKLQKYKDENVKVKMSIFGKNKGLLLVKNIFSFIKKTKKYGFMKFTLYLLHVNIENLIIIQGYSSKLNKFYQFPCKEEIFQRFTNFSTAGFKRKKVVQFVKKLTKPLKVVFDEGQNTFFLLKEYKEKKISIRGKQIILRNCYSQNFQLKFIDTYFIDSNQICDHRVPIFRQVMGVNERLWSLYSETFTVNISSFESSLSLIRKVKDIGDPITKKKLRNLFSKKKSEFYIPERSNLRKIEIFQKIVKMTSIDFHLRTKEAEQCQNNRCEQKMKNVYNLKGKSFLKYIKRQLKSQKIQF